MGLFGQLGSLLQQYSANSAPTNADQANDHFDQVARQVPSSSLAGALTHVFQSPETGTFGQNITDLFNRSNPPQRAGILNQLVPALGAGGLGSLGGALGSMFGSGGGGQQITPDAAQQVSAQDAGRIAEQAQRQNPSVVEQAGSFYAQHPTLVKALGAGAAIMALRHIAEAQQR